MKTFFKKLFKRGDFMTRADKWYYSKVIKTWLWSTFAFVIIAWVGTNLVLCALTTNVKSGGDLIYEVPRKDVFLPTGQDLCVAFKGTESYYGTDKTIKTITFDYEGRYSTILSGVEPETLSVENEIYLYRINDGADIYILSPNDILANENFDHVFYNFDALTQIKFNNFDTSSVKNMECMFCSCGALTELDLHSWDTSNVTTMERMFLDCNSLKAINGLNNFETGNVTTMRWMFKNCDALTKIDVSKWDTRKVINMEGVFWVCRALTEVDLTGWDTSNVTDMSYMFSSDAQLKTIYASSKFVTTNTTYSGQFYAFSNCKSLKGGKGTTYNASRYTSSNSVGLGYDLDYARIDGGPKSSTPGYFTEK